jgi:hypothetical protein
MPTAHEFDPYPISMPEDERIAARCRSLRGHSRAQGIQKHGRALFRPLILAAVVLFCLYELPIFLANSMHALGDATVMVNNNKGLGNEKD